MPRLPQWQARPLVRSTSSTTQTRQSSPANDFFPLLDPLDTDLDILEPWATGDEAPNAHEADISDGQHSPGRFSNKSPRKKHRNILSGPSRKSSLKIFENVVRQQVAQEKKAAAAAGPRDISPEGVEYYSNLAKLRPMMKEQQIEDCLDFFLENLWNKSPFEGRNRLLRQRGAYLMGKVAEAKMLNFDNERLPSVSQITRYYHEMDSLGSTKWCDMMMCLIRAILGKSPVRKESESDEAYAKAKAKKEELVDDLVDSWILFHRHKMSANDSTLQTSEEAEFRLPDINPNNLRYFAWKRDYKGALGCIFPDWMRNIKEIPAVAIATFVLLVDHDHSTTRARQKAKPLLVPIGRVVSACPFTQPAITEMLGSHPTVLLYVLKQWDTVVKRLHHMRGNHEEQVHKREVHITTGRLTQTVSLNEKGILAKIRYALSIGDVLTLENEWRAFWGSDKNGKDPNRTGLSDHPNIFDHFIMAFTALKKPLRAIDTWDAMIGIGLSPTLQTWSCMIEGCRKSRNAAGIENVWRKLVASGLPLDETVWSSRILGLMEAGEPGAGLRALNEMLKMAQLPGGVPLNIRAVNAAVTGLLRLNATSAANNVLTWASQHGIQPDVVTYNILLGPMVQQGQAAKIKSALQMMSANNIKPDAATYTILLEGFMNTKDNLTPAEEQRNVEKLLADMEKEGVVAYHETFARMLHLILRDGRHIENHTEGAVGAIFKHMDSKGMRPSPHMLTMLVDHYFAQNPPATKEVDLLLQPYLQRNGLFDRVFWERVIKGFALAGATDRAFALFEKTNNISSTITLDTVEILLRVLVRENDMSAAARLVDNVKRHCGASTGNVNNSAMGATQDTRWDRYWKHGFWGYAMDCGLLGAAEWRRMARFS